MFNLIEHLKRQNEFSAKTFGPPREPNASAGVIDHLKEEITEVESDPKDIMEWIDIMMLASDGAFREGYTPENIAAAWAMKLDINMSRTWPDWRSAEPGKAIKHVKH